MRIGSHHRWSSRTVHRSAGLAAAVLLTVTAMGLHAQAGAPDPPRRATDAATDPTARTISNGAIDIAFHPTNAEEITSITWNGSPNLTTPWANPFCPDDLEFWGNAWSPVEFGNFVSFVGWGTTGTWGLHGPHQVAIESRSDGCPGSAGLDVSTTYQLPPGGPAANTIHMKRTIDVASTSFTRPFRPYITRLSRNAFNEVWYPSTADSSLTVVDANDCEFGCRVTDWNDTWFAIHNPATETGLIIKPEPSAFDVDLWIDADGGSLANSSSVLLVPPPGGFTGKVVHREKHCFYDAALWPSTARESGVLPAGC